MVDIVVVVDVFEVVGVVVVDLVDVVVVVNVVEVVFQICNRHVMFIMHQTCTMSYYRKLKFRA